MADAFDPYYTWLAIPPEDQPPTLYRLLGLRPFEDNPEVIENVASQRTAYLRTLQAGSHAQESQRLFNEVAAARACLLNRGRKGLYDAKLREQMRQQAEGRPNEELSATLASFLQMVEKEQLQPRPPREPAATDAESIHDVSPAKAGSLVANLSAIFGEVTAAETWTRKHDILVGTASGVTVFLVLTLTTWLLFSGGGSDAKKIAVQTAPAPRAAAVSPGPTAGAPSPQPASEPVERPGKRPSIPGAPSAGEGPPSVEPGAASNPSASNPPSAQTPGAGTGDTPAAPGGDAPPGPNAPGSPPAPAARQRQPVPSAGDQQEAIQQIDKIYEVSKKTPPQKREIARDLLRMAGQSAQPAEQFACLRRSMELASAAGDAQLMIEAIDAMDRRFEIDVLMAKGKMLRSFAEVAGDAASLESLVAATRRYVRESAAADRYDFATSIATATFQACQRAQGAAFRREMHDLRRQVEKLRDDYEKVQQATAALAANPDDPAANLAMGRFHCFVRGEWDRGLPHLAKGSDAALAGPAGKDLAAPSQPADQVAVGDGWWGLAQSAAEPDKSALLRRARHWYQRARPALVGLEKAKVDKRLAESAHVAKATDVAEAAPAAAPSDTAVAVDIPGIQAPAERPKPPEPTGLAAEITLELATGVQLGMVLIRPGEFMMGSNDFAPDERPAHKVTITRPFYLGKHEVTQQQWQALMGGNPSNFQAPGAPVDQVTWNASQGFLAKLNEMFPDAEVAFCLPTEAQWEYACRAGTAGQWYCGDVEHLETCAWFSTNSGERTHPVGQKKPNAWGLYDMLGNVVEHCADWYSETYYAESPGANPPGPASGELRVMRGGGFAGTPKFCRATSRQSYRPGESDFRCGFRVAAMPRSAGNAGGAGDRSGGRPQPDSPAANASGNLLPNASFEEGSGDAPQGWQPTTWDGAGKLSWASVGHTGTRSLKSATWGKNQCDCGWLAQVPVAPHATYRLSGWIKTQNVEGEGLGAVLLVHEFQQPPRRHTPPLTGTHDWTHVETVFDSQDHDSLRINCCLGGWGCVAGEALFDDVRLERIR